MKKLFAILILSVLLVSLVAPVAVLAQKEKLKECCVLRQDISWKKGIISDCTTAGACTARDACTATAPCKIDSAKAIGPKGAIICPKLAATDVVDYSSDQWGIICLVNMVTYITNWIFYLMMIAVVIVFVAAGAKYMMSSGDTEKTKSAKNLIIFGIVGLIVALVAKLIPSVIRLVAGM